MTPRHVLLSGAVALVMARGAVSSPLGERDAPCDLRSSSPQCADPVPRTPGCARR